MQRVKLDNQIHLAHNCYIGENTIIGANTSIAGSVKIGNNCVIGGLCGIVDNIQITDEVTIYPMTFVTNNVKNKGAYSGGPILMEHKNWLKKVSNFKKKMIDIEEIRKYLPHRYPFLLVDRVIEIELNKYIRLIKT